MAIDAVKQVTVGTSEVALYSAPVSGVRQGVLIKALAANTGTVYIGLTGVLATTGHELSAGQDVTIPINHDIDANDETSIYAIASAAGQKISCLAV